MEDVFTAIAGIVLAKNLPGIGPFMPQSDDIVLQRPEFTLWRTEYTIMVDRNQPRIDDGDQKSIDYELNSLLIEDDGTTDRVPTPPNPFVEADGTF